MRDITIPGTRLEDLISIALGVPKHVDIDGGFYIDTMSEEVIPTQDVIDAAEQGVYDYFYKNAPYIRREIEKWLQKKSLDSTETR